MNPNKGSLLSGLKSALVAMAAIQGLDLGNVVNVETWHVALAGLIALLLKSAWKRLEIHIRINNFRVSVRTLKDHENDSPR